MIIITTFKKFRMRNLYFISLSIAKYIPYVSDVSKTVIKFPKMRIFFPKRGYNLSKEIS